MKKLMSLALLATLASCGGSGGSSKSIDPQRFQEAALSVERGLVSIKSTKGTSHRYYGSTEGNYSVSIGPEESEDYSVILKIEGTKIYKYLEERDLLEGTVQKSVEVVDFSSATLNEALKLPGASLNGSIFTLNMTEDSNFELGDNAVASSKYDLKMRVDLNNFHCSTTSSISEYNVKLTLNGVVTRAGDAGTTSATKCEAALSSAALKALDLSAISFCEESTTEEDEWNCESRNMEFLTDDLI